MVSTGLTGSLVASVWRATRSSLLSHSLRTVSYQEGKPEPVKQPLKKSKLPVGRFDAPEDSHLEKEPLKKFPDDVNPVTKEKVDPGAQSLRDMETGNGKDAVSTFKWHIHELQNLFLND